MKNQLLNLAQALSGDFKETNQDLDQVVDAHLVNDRFNDLCDSISELESDHPESHKKLYQYVYWHYC